MPEGITLKRIIDMDETEQLSSSDYVLVDSASGGNRKYKLGEDLNNLKEDFHEYHSELGAGYADQIVSSIENTDQTPYNFRAVPYDATLEKVEAIVGVDVVLNQLCNGASVTVPNGHKYYMLKGGTASVGASTGTAITGLTSGTDMVFDLTQTFGTAIADYVYSLEQSTAGAGVAWLKEHFPKIFNAGYVPYNAGTMVCVSGLSAHKTVGFNQWDEQWEVGCIDGSGQNIHSAVNIRSKNYITILPDTTYYLNCPVGIVYCPIYYYDKNKMFIKSAVQTLWNRTITTPSGVAYMRFFIHDSYGTTYNHDICINLSDPAKNGTYEPYTEHTYPLDSTVDLHGILKLDSANNLYADGDIYPPSGQVNHRYGVVDLGTLNWSYESSLGCFVSSAPTPTAKTSFKAICAKYPYKKSYTLLTDKTFGYVYNNAVAIKDSAYSDAPSLKASLSGVYMVYELATPTTETAEPYNPNQICDPNGTEEIISDTVAPVGHITRYPENLRRKIDNLPWNFASLIAPTEATFKATRNYTTGSLFIVNNVLYKATANIANGATITPNSNCSATTLAEVISALS